MRTYTLLWWDYISCMWCETTVFIFLIIGVYLFLKRSSASLKYFFLSIALIRFILPVSFEIPLYFSFFYQNQDIEEKGQIPNGSYPALSKVKPAPLKSNQERGGMLTFQSPHTFILSSLFTLHIFLTLFLMIMILRRLLRSLAFRKKLTLLRDKNVETLVSKVALQLHIKKRVMLYLSDKEHAPLLIGFFKPGIVIPKTQYQQMTHDMLAPVILHELAHYVRRDPFINLFQMVLQSIWFFHPALFLLNHLIRKERERACDDYAVYYGRFDQLWYAKILLFTQKSISQNAIIASSFFGMGGSTPEITQRIRRVVERNEIKRPSLQLSHYIYGFLFFSSLIVTTGSTWAIEKFSDANIFHFKGDAVMENSDDIIAHSQASELIIVDSLPHHITPPEKRHPFIYTFLRINGRNIYIAFEKDGFKTKALKAGSVALEKLQTNVLHHPISCVIDQNGNDDLSDDPEVAMETVYSFVGYTSDVFNIQEKRVSVRFTADTEILIKLQIESRFSENRWERSIWGQNLSVKTDTITIGNKDYKAGLWPQTLGGQVDKSIFFIDLNNNGRFDCSPINSNEMFLKMNDLLYLNGRRYQLISFSEDLQSVYVRDGGKNEYNPHALKPGSPMLDFSAETVHHGLIQLSQFQSSHLILVLFNSAASEYTYYTMKALEAVMNEALGKTITIFISGDKRNKPIKEEIIIAENKGLDGPLISKFALGTRATIYVIDPKGTIITAGCNDHFILNAVQEQTKLRTLKAKCYQKLYEKHGIQYD